MFGAGSGENAQLAAVLEKSPYWLTFEKSCWGAVAESVEKIHKYIFWFPNSGSGFEELPVKRPGWPRMVLMAVDPKLFHADRRAAGLLALPATLKPVSKVPIQTALPFATATGPGSV